MSVHTFHDVLEHLASASLNEQEKGDRFERLMVAYLKTEPAYAALYSEVWRWADFPGREGQPDTGIDLVAKASGSGELTAIQCKFYASTTAIQKSHIDSFLAASSKAQFSHRLIISTSDKWGANAEATLVNQSPPVERLRAADLGNSSIDWTQFSIEKPDLLVRRPPKKLRDYQEEAVTSVLDGLKTGDRGKLIMACGTGKTFTALKIAEQMVPSGGSALFLVPSISLLNQTLREWSEETERPLRSFAVCSDVSVGKRKTSEDISVTDLAFPATTDGTALAMKFDQEDNHDYTVVFSTYQSIEAVAAAQKDGVPEFDLIICDEAHRTTGVTLAGEDESSFVRVHDQSFVAGKKRLYMTATPRIFGDSAKAKADSAKAVLADMSDTSLYGEELHRLGFAEAVSREILTDYKVLILAVDEEAVGRKFQGLLADSSNEMRLEDAAKLVGCWNGLSKRANDPEEFAVDDEPMKRAVAFAGNIKNSKLIAQGFTEVVKAEALSHDHAAAAEMISPSVRHVDGTQNALVRADALDWLRAEPEEGECRILTNARCLSEGVDVPALDAVMFMAPRKSQVDVVQSVGRVMRKLDGKRYGYVILPIAVPTGIEPHQALSNNKKYQVVWQVLQALRSHDERLDATINKLDLTGNDTGGQVVVIGVGDGDGDGGEEDERDSGYSTDTSQTVLVFPELDEWKDAIFARIVQKVGDRQYWESWAKDIADIAQAHITRIGSLVDESDGKLRKQFDRFLSGLKDNLNPYLTEAEAVEMLAQHLITRPVFDALFEGYEFSQSNPVSQAMQKMIDAIEPEQLDKERADLDAFYDSVKMRASGITDASSKQSIVKDLYETFFRLAFPATASRLGIVYTPIEIVDFILRSTDEALRDSFGVGLTDKDVHVLDPFTGTGTFVVRLIQSGLITAADIERKYRNELHANEIVLLAYYVAAINIEEAYHDIKGGDYVPFDGVVLTDTFQMYEGDDVDELPGMEVFPENNERVQAQKKRDIRVIVGNPPYSFKQGSGNDDNQNLKYPGLDARVEETYAAGSAATSKQSLYDSYIRAMRWASDCIGDKGVICFITNGGFLDGGAAAGLRKSLTNEFSRISVLNLRGNQRTAGELSRKEGGKIFGSGSRASIAITLLVKDPEATAKTQAKLLYHDIGDYLSREQKLEIIREAGSMAALEATQIAPNDAGDWINQRSDDFSKLNPIGTKDKAESLVPMFARYSLGLASGRDAWAYNFSAQQLVEQIKFTIDFFNQQVDEFSTSPPPNGQPDIDLDPTKFSWNRNAQQDLAKKNRYEFATDAVARATYRPFMRTNLYFDRDLNAMQYQLPRFFPSGTVSNFGIALSGAGSADFAVIAVDAIPDINLLSATQFFPRYTFATKAEESSLLSEAAGYEQGRIDNITDSALQCFQSQFGDAVTKDDIFFYIYGLLHSPMYRTRFAADLMKMLPRIPMVENWNHFASAGRKLSELHLGYEELEPYPLKISAPNNPSYRVEKMRFAKIGKERDRSTIIYNSEITLSGIPEEAYRYTLGSRSAVEWIMDRYRIRQDRASGIINDPNKWSEDAGDPSYVLDLLGRIVRVSIETMEIVDALPKLKILDPKGGMTTGSTLFASEGKLFD